MRDSRGTVRPTWALTICAITLIALVSIGAGWLVAGRATAAVVVAVLTSIFVTFGAVRLLVGCGVVAIHVAAPTWLRRWERTFDAAPRHTQELERALTLAAGEARHFCQREIGSEHLLLGLMRADGDAARTLERCGVTVEALIRSVDLVSGMGDNVDGAKPTLSVTARTVIERAEQRAADRRAHAATGTDVLLAITTHKHYAGAVVLEALGCTPARLLDATRARRSRGR